MNGPVQVLDLAQCGFRAMGTEVEVLVLDGDDADLHWAHAEVDRLEALWSRFRDDSEVARLNRHAGDWVDVAPETTEVLRAAIQAWNATDGAFDPLLGWELAALGYDHSFEQVDVTGAGAACPPSTPVPRRAGDLLVDGARRRARVVPGRALDLGGIAKGWTADWLVAGLLARGAAGACANLGGDLAVAGRAPQADGWYVAVDHRAASTAPAMLALRQGGVATSTILRRRWRGPGGDARHHLVDPQRGTSCRGAIAEVTVAASSAARGEVLTKVAFITPDQLGRSLGPGEGALLTTADGRRESIGDIVVVHPVEGIVPDAG